MLRHAEPYSLPYVPFTTGATNTDGKLNLAGHAAADVGKFVIPFKCEVIEAGAVVVTNFVGASIADGRVKLDSRANAGSDTDREDGDIADLNFGTTGASAQGDVVYDLVGQGNILEPGQEVVVEVITGITQVAGATTTGAIARI